MARLYHCPINGELLLEANDDMSEEKWQHLIASAKCSLHEPIEIQPDAVHVYIPEQEAHWEQPPVDLKQALDALAKRVFTLEQQMSGDAFALDIGEDPKAIK